MRGARTVAAAVLLALSALGSAQGKIQTVSASCGRGCTPSPASFSVPSAMRARGFALRTLVAGRPCAGGATQELRGFSLRKGGRTVLVYYTGPAGPVSDPVPLEDLELPPGDYQLLAVPAEGASVTLAFQLVSP